MSEPTVDPVAIAARRDQVVERLHKGLLSLVRKNSVDYIRGHGRLDGPTRVRVERIDDADQPIGEVVLEATDVILATGSRVKSLPGLEPDGVRIQTSDDILRSDSVPASLIVVGAGAVGVEFASYYADLGTEVTVLEYLPAVVPLEDAEVSKEMERAFRKRGIRVVTGARFDPSAVTVDGEGVRLMVGREGEEPAELRAERMLVATGRAANTDDVGLETTKAVVERGIVQVDAEMRTADPHLYAIGDIIGGLWLAHVAAHEGIAAVHAIAGREVEPVDYLKMPTCDVQPAAGRVDRALAAGVRARRDPRPGREVPVPGQRQGHHQRRHVGLREGHRPRRDRRGPGRAHDRVARDRAHRRGQRDDAVRGDRLGARRGGASAPHAFGGARRGRPRRGRQVDQLLTAATVPRALGIRTPRGVVARSGQM